MIRWTLSFLTLLTIGLQGTEQLDARYLVQFGSSDAKIEIVEYFSFSCPHCIRVYRQDFANIEKKYIETGLIQWKFHPLPMDMLTVQAMACLEQLNLKQKQIFLKAMLSLAPGTSSDDMTRMMQEGMEAIHHPLPFLSNLDFLKKTDAFKAAFQFASQEQPINEVPSLEVNGTLISGFPDEQTVGQHVRQLQMLNQLPQGGTK